MKKGHNFKGLAFVALTAVALAGCQDLTHQVAGPSDSAGPSELRGPPFNPGPPDNPGRPDFLFENLNVAHVCPASTRPGSFATMEEALNAVIPGGTIQVCDGTHVVQDIRVLKPVTIEAKGPGVPVLDGLGEAGSGFTVTFRGLRFEHMPETAILIDANYDVVLVENSQFFPNAEQHVYGRVVRVGHPLLLKALSQWLDAQVNDTGAMPSVLWSSVPRREGVYFGARKCLRQT